MATASGKLGLLPATSVEELGVILEQIDQSETLESYLAWFQYTIPVLQTRDALFRAAYELAEDNANENVRYLEVRYAPILHTEDGLDLKSVNDAVLAGLRQAESEFNIKTNIIICGLRDRFESSSMLQAELASQERGNGVVAFDLAGGESGNPPKQHLHAFYYARNNLLSLTIHAGESFGPESIRQAVFYCGAHRIGHGITLHEDEDLMQYFVDHQIPLEICPTSNVQTHVVASFEEHPISTFVNVGVPVTVNTDNRLFSRTSVTEELWRTHKLCGVAAGDIANIVLNGFKYSFQPRYEKLAMLEEVAPLISLK